VAIGGGGFIPARMLRTYLHIPIYAVGLQLYDDHTNTPSAQPIKTQWLDKESGFLERIKGKRVLIVDEVDDSRLTLHFCVQELQKHGPSHIGVLVVHNKRKEKKAQLDATIPYFACQEVGDEWLVYPWDAHNVEEHETKSQAQREAGRLTNFV